MKVYSSVLTILLLTWSLSQAQNGDEFDFWVGDWDLSWEYPDGAKGSGHNTIEKILDSKVLQENFEATDTGPYSGFKGMSISVFNPNSKTWHQAWADNQGGYFNFIGEVDNHRRIFKTKPYQRDDNEIILRMVFNNITENSFTWDWEQSKDGGQNWVLQWRIQYQRAP